MSLGKLPIGRMSRLGIVNLEDCGLVNGQLY